MREAHSAPWHCHHPGLEHGEVNTSKSEVQQTAVNTPLEWSLFILHYFCAAFEWKVTLNPCPQIYLQHAKRGEKTCCCSSVWSSTVLKILNAAFETASPEARESQSFAFLGGLNSVTDLAKGQFSEPLHKSNATETMAHTRGSERQPQTLLESESKHGNWKLGLN